MVVGVGREEQLGEHLLQDVLRGQGGGVHRGHQVLLHLLHLLGGGGGEAGGACPGGGEEEGEGGEEGARAGGALEAAEVCGELGG